MANFAKLCTLACGEQLLVMIGSDDDDLPEVRFTTEVDGVRVSMACSFGRKDEAKPFDEAHAWKLARDAFEATCAVDPEEIRRTLETSVRNPSEIFQ